jgi:hypothetical protein
MNFGELKSDIRSYTEVDSTVLNDAILTTIVKNAEARIFRETDTDDARFYDTITLTPGNREVAAPAAVRKNLELRDTSFMEEYYNTPGTAAAAPNNIPKYYANRNASTIFLAPTPDAAYVCHVAYVKQPDSITASDATTTYVSTNYPDLILYACLAETYGYLKGPTDMLQLYEQSYGRSMATYGIEQQGRRRRDEYMDGTIRTAINSPSPGE